ncbi:MAG: S8 family serine peptidase, partial [Chloroflexota bacterium]
MRSSFRRLGTSAELAPVLVVVLLVALTQWASSAPYDDRSPRPTATASGTLLVALQTSEQPGPGHQRPDHAPDQLIVRFKPGIDEPAAKRTGAAHGLAVARKLLLDRYFLLSVPAGKDLPVLMDALRKDPAVESVEPNAYRYADFI